MKPDKNIKIRKHMPLGDYMKAKGITMHEMATLMGFKAASSIFDFINQVRMPRVPETTDKFEAVTNGIVTLQSFINERRS